MKLCTTAKIFLILRDRNVAVDLPDRKSKINLQADTVAKLTLLAKLDLSLAQLSPSLFSNSTQFYVKKNFLAQKLTKLELFIENLSKF